MMAHLLPILYLLSCLLALSAGCTIKCPESSSSDPSYLPSPFDCSKYYVCVHNVPVEMVCPEGLWFDSELNTCNYPKDVICNNSKFVIRILSDMFASCYCTVKVSVSFYKLF